MEEFNIKISVRNNLILQSIKDYGYTNLHNFAKECELSINGLYDLVNLKEPPLNIDGEFSKPARKLMEVLGACPTDLWTEEQLTLRLRSNKFDRSFSKEGLQIALQSNARSLIGFDYPEQKLEEIENARLINDKLNSLLPTETKVLSLRYGFNDNKEHTLEEIGSLLNLTGARIRQIEMRALRKLRHPYRSDDLQDSLITD